jgi:PAS domain S-box-containing protein
MAGMTESREKGNGMDRQSGDLSALPEGRSRDGVLLIDQSGSLVEWNQAMEQITGMPRTEVLGKKVWEIYFSLLPPDKKTPLYHEHLKDLVLGSLKAGLSPDPVRSFEYEIQRPDTGIRIVESIMFVIPQGDRTMAGSILRDITDRKKAEAALQEANRKLTIISSTARHDINNQLTVFSGYLSLLDYQNPAMKAADVIRILQGATARIEQILKFTGEYQDIGAESPAWQVPGEVIRLAKTMIENVAVRLSPDPSCDEVEIRADPQLVRAFYHLIDNSLRHGEKVSVIQIHCSVENNLLLIAYEDDGIGIPDRIRPVLFERGKGKTSGYGMFLVREILTATGITITEKGVAGKGARFEIIVPSGSFRIIGRK